MAAKKRCQLQGEPRCNSAVLRLVGQCPHCRAEFCATVRPFLPFPQPRSPNSFTPFPSFRSTGCQSITAAKIWRAADSKRSRRTRPSSRVNGQWLPRWRWHDRAGFRSVSLHSPPSHPPRSYRPVLTPCFPFTIYLPMLDTGRSLSSPPFWYPRHDSPRTHVAHTPAYHHPLISFPFSYICHSI